MKETEPLVFFQHGDYGEAFRRFRAGGDETYRDQRVSVDFVEKLSQEREVVVVAVSGRPHHETLAPGLRSVGLGVHEGYNTRVLFRLLDEIAPGLLIARSPNRPLFRWARHHDVPILPYFADTFANDSPRQIVHNLRLRWQMRGRVPCVANHSLNASASVVKALFFPAAKVVPWDRTPLASDPAPKRARPAGAWRAFYAGALSEQKGVGDCLEAVRMLKEQGLFLGFDFAGGNPGPWQQRATEMGLDDRVTFLGIVPNAEVRRRMRAADVVVVPSRHDYAEGLPNTMCEALASRTPLVVSDHPVFAGRLKADRDCLVFQAAAPATLADSVARLMQDPALYHCLSSNSDEAQKGLYIGLNWQDLVRLFLADPDDRTGWVEANSLARLTASDV